MATMFHAWTRHPALWPIPYRRGLLMVIWVSLIWGIMQGMLAWTSQAGRVASTPSVSEQAMLQEIDALQTRRTELTQALAQHAQRLPDQRLPQVLQDIQRTARQHGLTLDVFKPLPLRMGATHAELPVQIKLQANYEALLGFLRDVSQLARPVSVSDLHIHTATNHASPTSTPHSEDPALTLEAQLSVLRLLSAQELAQRKTEPHNAAKTPPTIPLPMLARLEIASNINPFDPQRLNNWLRAQQPPHEPLWLAAERARTPQWLERFALDQLQWVGQLMQDGQRVALIKAAQRIHQVRIGQYLGPHGGRVLSIDEQTLTLREIFQNEAGQWQQRQVVLKLERAS